VEKQSRLAADNGGRRRVLSRLFGPARQNGYVVRDIEAAMLHWAALGVGPWYYAERVPVGEFEYRGRPGEIELSIALANSGALQLELIQQRNDAPSLYQEFLRDHGEGLQHISAWTTDMVGDLARISGQGVGILQQGLIGHNRFVYFDTEAGHPSTVMELFDVSGEPGRLFEEIRLAAADWDGSDPIRR
jgi:hypothetical protein